jgi:hypothetical protein
LWAPCDPGIRRDHRQQGYPTAVPAPELAEPGRSRFAHDYVSYL